MNFYLKERRLTHKKKGGQVNLTHHCLVRCRQRGIKEVSIEIIKSLGTKVIRPGGVCEYFISRKDKQKAVETLKKCIQSMDRLEGKSIIIDEEDNEVITTYHKK